MSFVTGGNTIQAEGPYTVEPTLEQQFDDAVRHIEKIDAEMKELRAQRETYLEQAYEARAKLIEKCDSADCLLNTPKLIAKNY